ncbi:lysophospholipid acyltransferase family protein [Zhongshania aliphaticivorans]|uniref:lysophospholipid acyltransferase family protein n=1 Tax=Zhongshania aliphaticivorans TaxID=1470434 RepID=UPI00190F5D04|nr:lysophospholipid acyltransferase family protein [Zhongshania aliphaticivorans]
MIPAIATPVLYLIARDKRQNAARKLVHFSFKSFVYIMRGLGVLRWDIKGEEKLKRQNGLVLANHPTLIDVVFLVALIPNANCVVKERLLRNPAMRGFISLTGYIPNNDSTGLLDSESDFGGLLVVFPEGTRSTAGQPLKMQRGAANIAIRKKTNITPVIIQCNPATLSKQHKWYHIPERTFTVSITVKDDINISEYLDTPATLAARHLTKHLEQYFSQEAKV